jgi:tape measure domain-containing protein
MFNGLEYILKLKDQFSADFMKAAGVADNAAVRINNDMNKMTGNTNSFKHSLGELKGKLDSINATRMNTHIPDVFRTATREAKKLEDQINKIENKGKGSGGIGGLLAGFGVAAGLGLVGKSAIGGAAEREQQQISFGVMTGSQATGDKLLNDIIAMGAATPFESGDLIKNAQVMKAFGIDTKDILPTLQMLGDVSGGNAEKLQGLSLAYAQVQSTGRLMGQDLLQMVNQGFNPLQIISQKTGLSMAVLKDKMEKGQISASMVTDAFKVATSKGGMFNGMMEKQSHTMAGRWSTVVDNTKQKLVALGQILSPVINWIIDLTNAIISSTPTMTAIAFAIGAITLAIYGVSWATKGWAIAQGIVNAVMMANPIIFIVTLIIGLIIWVYTIIQANKNWGISLKAIWEITKSVFALMVLPIKQFWEDLSFWFTKAWYTIEDWGERVWQYMKNLWAGIKAVFTDGWDAAKAAVNQTIHTQAEVKIASLEKEHGAASKGYADEFLNEIKSINSNYNKIDFSIAKGKTAKNANPLMQTAGAGAGGFAGLGADALGKSAKDKADAVNSGGQRSIVININKQVGAENIHVMSGAEAANNIESLVREAMRRMLLSLNGNAVANA